MKIDPSIRNRNNYRKVKNRPTKEELQILINSKPYTSIGKDFGVSSNAVKKWAITYGIYVRKHKIPTGCYIP